MKNNLKEKIVAVCLLVVALFLLNPFHFWMPDMLVMCMLASALALVSLFALFILREKDFDERDTLHKTLASRNAFIAGSFILTLGIVFQGYSHKVDPWLVIALFAMVLTKIISRIWTDKNL